MRNKSRKISLVVALALILSLTFGLTAEVFAASPKTKKMTAYDDVIKVGKTAYCATVAGIYKVNLRTGKSKRLTKTSENYMPFAMKKKGKYIYYLEVGPNTQKLYRIKTNGKNKKLLYKVAYYSAVDRYAISKNKIYLIYNKDGSKKAKRIVMKLNGKGKKSTKIVPEMTFKQSNHKGYKGDEKVSGYKRKLYLKTPKKKILIDKVKMSTTTGNWDSIK